LISKIKDIIIYRNADFHCAFPSIIRTSNGNYLLAFRKAPNRIKLGEDRNYHVDANSYLYMIRSKDGIIWNNNDELLYANPLGGSQDPCLLQLRNGDIFLSSYLWSFSKPEIILKMKKPITVKSDYFVLMGGYCLKSTNEGKNWSKHYPPLSISSETRYNSFGKKLPSFNRGSLYENKAGNIFWVVASQDQEDPQKKSAHLICSKDSGLTWEYMCVVAEDKSVSFNETSIIETPAGNIVAFMRTNYFEGHACIARSINGGLSFQDWRDMGFTGYPLHALQLKDGKVLLTYGYRNKPYGIRARILNAECTNYETAPEIIIRDDGASDDLGYPWSIELDSNNILVIYYFDDKNNIPFIAGTILKNDNT
jgi:sialidase-1